MQRPHHVVVLVLDGALPLDVGIPAEVFHPETGFGYEVSVCGVTAGTVPSVSAYLRQFISDTTIAAQRYSLVDSLAMDARIQRDLAVGMAGIDALVCPTSAVTTLHADGEYVDGIDAGGRHLTHYWEAHMTAPFNVANSCPVLSIPSGMSAAGVPTGVQVVGHPNDETMAFRVGAAVESLAGFGRRRPDQDGAVRFSSQSGRC